MMTIKSVKKKESGYYSEEALIEFSRVGKIYHDNPSEDNRILVSETHKKFLTPEMQVAGTENSKKYWEMPGTREKASKINIARWKNPEIRKKILDAHADRWEDPETRKRMLDALSTPEVRNKRSESLKKAFASLDMQQKLDMQKKLSESHKKSWEIKKMETCWYGAVQYGERRSGRSGSKLLYCEKWTKDLRQRVRAFFGNRCVGCGYQWAPGNNLLHVHHVWYNKKLCCDDSPRSLVSLCHSCHSKTGHNREYWSKYFQDIIDIYYGGRCWFTKDEMGHIAFKYGTPT